MMKRIYDLIKEISDLYGIHRNDDDDASDELRRVADELKQIKDIVRDQEETIERYKKIIDELLRHCA